MSLASRTTLEKAVGVVIGVMAVELVLRSAFGVSLAMAVFSGVVR